MTAVSLKSSEFEIDSADVIVEFIAVCRYRSRRGLVSSLVVSMTVEPGCWSVWVLPGYPPNRGVIGSIFIPTRGAISLRVTEWEPDEIFTQMMCPVEEAALHPLENSRVRLARRFSQD